MSDPQPVPRDAPHETRSARPDDLLALAVELARAAGTELLRRYGNVQGLETKSTATDPVSDADRAAERLIDERLRQDRPDDGLLGEEGTDRAGTSGLRWIVDPLDGTVNYLYGVPSWSVSIGVEDATGPLVGAVYEPLRDTTWTAVRGGGARRLDRDGTAQTLRVNDPVPLERCLLATGFSYAAPRRAVMGRAMGLLLPQIRDLRRIGSAALDLCRVAEGAVDAYLEEGINDWDIAAGRLIATEAGAVVDWQPTTQGHRALVAAGPAVAPALRAALADALGAGAPTG